MFSEEESFCYSKKDLDWYIETIEGRKDNNGEVLITSKVIKFYSFVMTEHSTSYL